MSSTLPVIVWFRQDLRVTDNPALSAAAASGRPIVAVYILDDGAEDIRALGGASRWWLHHSLELLSAGLLERGLSLILRKGPASRVLDDLVQDTSAETVYWNRCYEPWAITRDTAIKDTLKNRGVSAESFNSALLLEPWKIKTGQGGPYKVFTPFWRRLRELYRVPEASQLQARLTVAPCPESDALEAWDLCPRQPDWAGGLRTSWQVGEASARSVLLDFLDGPVANYPTDRDLPDRVGTSRLSPHLHWGEIGPHQVWRVAAALLDEGGARAVGAESLLRQLAWRDFNHHLMFHFPGIATENWKPKFNRFPWLENPKGLATWQRGQTGYPIVDAGMRELWHTGWMHNRVRMITGSFLIKDLMIHWREGEDWFWDTLVDADLANNAGNWQWVAGSGADASPFFRIFNPTTQGEKFDPGGAYIRKWVPELVNLPDKWIHKPWAAPPEVLAATKIKLGEDYPKPLVDHVDARNRALEAYKSIRGAESE
ncbi:MAG: deoxyribodipyrimidine photo-lyase [Alphaproteobacteria bacterium]|nr:deoxyribodipyrimidine photo-lyase [Alphaproteobacteria bacterium]